MSFVVVDKDGRRRSGVLGYEDARELADILEIAGNDPKIVAVES